MLTLDDFRRILKSRVFKSKVEGHSDSHTFTFTEIYVFRDGKALCIYELVEGNGSFKFIFSHLVQNVSIDNFDNVTIAVNDDNRFPIVVNSNSLALMNGGSFDIMLIAE